jgi:hypothetical protein
MTRPIEPPQEPWRLKREVSVGDLVAFGAAALSVAYAYTTLDKRLALVEAEQRVAASLTTTDKAAQAAKDRAQDEEHFRSLARIERSLGEIQADMKKLAERR